MSKLFGWSVPLGIMGLVFVICRASGDDDKPQTDDQKLAARFLKKVKDKDLDGLSALVQTPWLADNRTIVKDDADVKKLLRHLIDKPGTILAELTPRDSVSYANLREDIKDKAVKDLFDEAVGNKGRIMLLVVGEKKPTVLRYLLVRGQGKDARIVGGPYKATYLVLPNELPQTAQEALEKAESVELFSISPVRPKEVPKDNFRGWEVLGKTIVKDKEARQKLLKAFKQSFDDAEGFGALCFNPRHGMRVSFQGKTSEFVICFECFQLIADNQQLRIGDSAQALFNKVLGDAGVPLAK